VPARRACPGVLPLAELPPVQGASSGWSRESPSSPSRLMIRSATRWWRSTSRSQPRSWASLASGCRRIDPGHIDELRPATVPDAPRLAVGALAALRPAGVVGHRRAVGELPSQGSEAGGSHRRPRRAAGPDAPRRRCPARHSAGHRGAPALPAQVRDDQLMVPGKLVRDRGIHFPAHRQAVDQDYVRPLAHHSGEDRLPQQPNVRPGRQRCARHESGGSRRGSRRRVCHHSTPPWSEPPSTPGRAAQTITIARPRNHRCALTAAPHRHGFAAGGRYKLTLCDRPRTRAGRTFPSNSGATPRPDGLTADGAQNRMLRASEMAVRQRSQMPLMVRQISLCPGLACPGLAALPSWGK